MQTWEAIRAERASLVDALTELPDETWDKPSLCAGWKVRDIVAHLIATAQMTPPKFFGRLAASGFRFDAMTANNIRQITEGRSNADLVALLRSRVGTRNAPPGPATSWLGETIVHGEDIFRAFGPYRDHPVAHVVAVADFYAGSNLLIGAKSRIAGVTLRATDVEWSRGTGPELAGPAIALVMAMTGRTEALQDLRGDGVAVVRDRA
jgi:uncharacterized protein (TIGR03083 family)